MKILFQSRVLRKYDGEKCTNFKGPSHVKSIFLTSDLSNWKIILVDDGLVLPSLDNEFLTLDLSLFLLVCRCGAEDVSSVTLTLPPPPCTQM